MNCPYAKYKDTSSDKVWCEITDSDCDGDNEYFEDCEIFIQEEGIGEDIDEEGME